MGFAIEVVVADAYELDAANYISERLPQWGDIVLTGGTTAEALYGELASCGADWSRLTVYFSDERCVPPDDPRSNFGMARRLLLDRVRPGAVERMRGEEPPEIAAADYHQRIAPAATAGFDLVVLGMGADAHVCALFPSSPALEVTGSFCVPVDRPDGLRGLTLTPPALRSAKRVVLIVTGEAKAEAVRRAVTGGEEPSSCPVRVLADHPDVTFLLDEAASARL